MNLSKVGVKGSNVYTSTGVENPLVALSVKLVRGVNKDVVANSVFQALLEVTNSNALQALQDIFVLLFQTRDVRGGKGERAAAMAMWDMLLNNEGTKDLALDLLDLVPEYGCWQDLFKMPSVAWSRVLELVESQILKDEQALCDGSKLSLLAKWMPREGQPMATFCASKLVHGQMFSGTRMKLYRKRLARLNRAIDTVEIKMCGKTWANIDPAKVPGRAVNKYTKAFLNELGTKGKGKRAEEGIRHPFSEDRMECRDSFKEHFSKAASGAIKAKGADTLFPHEVVKKAMYLSTKGNIYNPEDSDSECVSEHEKNSLRGVWREMVEVARAGGGLGRSLAMCDFSGSMQSSGNNGDTPYWVSMALGLLISEVTTEEFKDLILTFDSKPNYHQFPKGDLFTKLNSIRGEMAQGTSTDFQKAMELVLQRLKERRVRPGQEPENLIVLTDMNWDMAHGSSEVSGYSGNMYRHVVKTKPWQTHVEMIRESFKRAGEDMWGVGWKMPRIIIWNIASTSSDFHAQATTEGVAMISGWSPSLLKVLQAEGPAAAVMTPLKALRLQLDDPRYDLVRDRVKTYRKE